MRKVGGEGRGEAVERPWRRVLRVAASGEACGERTKAARTALAARRRPRLRSAARRELKECAVGLGMRRKRSVAAGGGERAQEGVEGVVGEEGECGWEGVEVGERWAQVAGAEEEVQLPRRRHRRGLRLRLQRRAHQTKWSA